MKKLVTKNLYLSFGVIALIICGIGIFAYSRLTEVIETAMRFSKARSVLQDCDRLLADVTRADSATRAFIITGEQHYLSLAQTARDSAARDAQQLEATSGDERVPKSGFSTLNSLVGDKFSLSEKSLEKRPEAPSQSELVLKMTRDMEQIVSQVGEIRNTQFMELKDQEKVVASDAQRVLSVVLYGGFTTVAFTALLYFLVQNCLKDLTEEGRLTARSLGEAVEQILNSTSRQAASCTAQAAVVAEANATVREMSRSGLQMAEKSKEMAECVSKAASSGLEALQEANSAMLAIGERAEAAAENALSLNDKTLTAREITATVNEIAQQSHLLALNAAIQAAAAGEQGFAFAAVATEIKSLADQSREATQQMRSILSDIEKATHTSILLTEEAVKRVEQAKQQIETAVGTIREVDDSIQQSVHAFQRIGANKNEQQTAFQQVIQAFENIDRAGEETAAGTRQLERSAINLMTLGRQLAQVVEHY